MGSEQDIITRIEACTGEKIIRTQSIGGGCIANARRITTGAGRSFFMKSGFHNSMFRNEANGLKELAKANAIRVPKVLLQEDDFLLLEFIPQGGRKRNFFEDFGRRFARMHRYQAEQFGFYEDNFIGATPQVNIPVGDEATNWTSFYMNKRLLFQFQLAERNGYADEKLRSGFRKLEEKIEDILEGSEEPPTLLHGDLWSGNYMSDENGEPVIIDPAVYYGHREADLAMTKLFGGFSSEFYSAYREENPLPDGYEYRENIYLLYHVMNHLNLFGSSYYGQAVRLLRSYL
ncbi:fructosamine kinase family protein [Prolixibacter sp. SD074]|jgi:fructosamine-3-kinase|uniref:fructosamine kinase family protein n=1 Tax=Prolixibacter sp. SD074 TaxID=2652391 RepID=UPI0012714A4C|nr:fructosamine kinase family protein [Prolixibacter sp. SD074]GET27835.1 fructosamine kinase [Prolixibacter sp. SD074]GET31122.1 fructosamine kinase [Prolixibacter sp. SD074]